MGIHSDSISAFTYILLSLFTLLRAQAQGEKPFHRVQGIPEILNYSQQDFKGDSQFWVASEDQQGILYFGNNDGVLIFDGERWDKVPLPNKSSVRSLTTDETGKVYVGGYNEIGRIQKDPYGRYTYKSLLKDLNIQIQNLENLWQVHCVNERIVYRSFKHLIAIHGDIATSIPAKGDFIYANQVNGQYYVQDTQLGLLCLDIQKKQLSTLIPSEQLNEEQIVAILPSQSTHQLLIFTKPGQVFRLDLQTGQTNPKKRLFDKGANNQVLCGLKSPNGWYYLGTLSNQMIILDESGEIKAYRSQHINLKDKTILNLFQQKNGNIWVMLNNGLSLINFTAPCINLFDQASVYKVLIRKDTIFIATNQGVFYSSIKAAQGVPWSLNMSKLPNLEGQTWSIQSLDKSILISHDQGLFELEDMIPHQIGKQKGFWKVIANPSKNNYLACSYHGLYLLKKDSVGHWIIKHKIQGFDESARDIIPAEEPGTYWICHGYKGVYRIKIDTEYQRVTSTEKFTEKNGLPSIFNINVTTWEGENIFTTNQGVYTFDYETNRFIPFKQLNDILGAQWNTRKITYFENTVWFIQDDEVGYFNKKTPQGSLNKEPLKQLKGTFNRGLECILPLDHQQVLLGTNTGLYLFNLNQVIESNKVPTRISRVYYFQNKEKVLLPLQGANTKAWVLPNDFKGIHFDFAAPNMSKIVKTQYSYKLEPMDEDWSNWQVSPTKDFTHLKPGTYVFKVKSKSLEGTEGEESIYTFSILPLWYQTSWAYLIYGLLTIFTMWSVIYLVRKKIALEKRKSALEAQKGQKLLELEIAQVRLEAEKEKINRDKLSLQEDLIFKSKELANYTMSLVKKKEVFSEISEELKELLQVIKEDKPRQRLRKIVSKLNQHLISEKYMKVFEVNFEKVHQNFFKNLKNLNPELSQRELRICAFVKMNLSNKEISPLLNISVRGVETARYRLRKKLNLESEQNLVDFLEHLDKA